MTATRMLCPDGVPWNECPDPHILGRATPAGGTFDPHAASLQPEDQNGETYGTTASTSTCHFPAPQDSPRQGVSPRAGTQDGSRVAPFQWTEANLTDLGLARRFAEEHGHD